LKKPESGSWLYHSGFVPGSQPKGTMMNKVMELPGSQPGLFPWDQWEHAAKNRGMERTLAELGRAVLREAENHNWSEPLRRLCDPDALEELLFCAPFLGRRLCEILLETDGLRVALPEDGGHEFIQLSGFGGQY
jgi:hypothetical protein